MVDVSLGTTKLDFERSLSAVIEAGEDEILSKLKNSNFYFIKSLRNPVPVHSTRYHGHGINTRYQGGSAICTVPGLAVPIKKKNCQGRDRVDSHTQESSIKSNHPHHKSDGAF